MLHILTNGLEDDTREGYILFLQLIKELVFPRCCAGCGVEIETGFLCRECRRGLLQMKDFPAVENLDGGMFFFAYENRIKEAIHRIKFEQDIKLLSLLSEEMELLLADLQGKKIITNFLSEAGKKPYCAEKDCTDNKLFPISCPKAYCREKCGLWLWSGIPTDPGRLRRRGFDLPTELFSKGVEGFGGIWTQTLCRTRKTLPMYGLSPDERIRNLQDCFAVTRDVRGKSVMLADDIFTTGSTFSAAAAVLKRAGAVTVTGLAFCGSIENLR